MCELQGFCFFCFPVSFGFSLKGTSGEGNRVRVKSIPFYTGTWSPGWLWRCGSFPCHFNFILSPNDRPLLSYAGTCGREGQPELSHPPFHLKEKGSPPLGLCFLLRLRFVPPFLWCKTFIGVVSFVSSILLSFWWLGSPTMTG